MVQDTEQVDVQQALHYQMVKTRMEALTMITATFEYHDKSDTDAIHGDAALVARAAFMKRAGEKSAQYAAHRCKNQFQLMTSRPSSRSGENRSGEKNCAMMAMEISTIDTSDALAEEYLNTVRQDSTVWRMASMLAGSGNDMVFLVTSEGGGVSIKEIEGRGCMDAVNGILLFT